MISAKTSYRGPLDRFSADVESRAGLSAYIREFWTIIISQAEYRGLPKKVSRVASSSLPTTTLELAGSSTKVSHGAEERDVLPAVVYLAGAAAWKSLCLWSTPTCRATCLGHKAGMLKFVSSFRAQAWKTALYIGAPLLYRRLVLADFRKLATAAKKLGALPAMRLDGSSDTGLAKLLIPEARELGIQLYDYTKSIGRAQAELNNPDWHVTLSYPGLTGSALTSMEGIEWERGKARAYYAQAGWKPYDQHVRDGGSVAVVVGAPKGTEMPDTFRGLPAIAGDETDLRFLDPKGRYVLLTVKGDKRNAKIAREGLFSVPLQ